ncbi:MAG: molybdenum ABC transporter ATP-binding protein [Alphaproteobacteria bacterium]|nr:molybdenum ABC transporter ATP-binding protein [Alphaproteobacteria bacterium]
MIDLDFRERLGSFDLDIRLAAPAGVVALFGRSGSGKTSVVRAIAGLSRPREGRIAVAGTALFDSAAGIDLPAERRRVGYVFQDARLFPHMNVEANLRYGQRRSGAAEGPDEFGAIVELLGIGALLARRPGTLSGGERQRVAVGRALLARPRVLLMDEPLASLDAARKAEVLPYLDGLRHRLGIPIVYVTHSIDEVLRLADTLALVDGGRIAVAGPVTEVMARVDLGPLVGRFEAGAAIDTVIAGHDDRYALTRLAFDGGELVVPAVDAAPGTELRVLVRARDVMLATQPPGAISARNVYAGRISALALEEGAHAEAAIAVGGVRLRARITRAAVAELGLSAGMPVYAIVKSVAVGRPGIGARNSSGRTPA